MKKIMTALALCFFAEVAWCGDGAQWVPGEIIIQIKSAKVDLPRIGKSFNFASLDDLGAKNGLMEYRRILPKADPRLPNISRMFLLKFPEEADVPGLCRQYALDPIVEHAEPNYLGGLCGTPNDAYWPLQWGMFGDRLNLPAAWDLAYPTSPSPDGIVIAVMDNGIDTLHPDLRPALWFNSIYKHRLSIGKGGQGEPQGLQHAGAVGEDAGGRG